jgi:RHS repeat-associated protein
VAAADGSGPTPVGGSDTAAGLGTSESAGAAWANGLASIEPATGAARVTLPFQLPTARGLQPSLALEYLSSGGDAEAGPGWSLSLPSIERRSPAGLARPSYHDPAPATPIDDFDQQDRFVFNGGQALVPICYIQPPGGPPLPPNLRPCVAGPDGTLPDFLGSGWYFFRLQVEHGDSLRFFWSPDHQTWLLQNKLGATFEFGVPRDGRYDATNGVDLEPIQGVSPPSMPYRWKLVREYDSNRIAPGVPANPVVYTWNPDGTLSDIYDTPTPGQTWPDLGSYAHHVHVTYQGYPFPRAMPPVWRRTPPALVSGVDVTSAPFDGGGARELVRRYHLSYASHATGVPHHEYLERIQLEGRCSSPVAEDPQGHLPTTSCPTLPATTMSYSGQVQFNTNGVALADTINSTPSGAASIIDINADGLPDFLDVAPGPGFPQNIYLNGTFGTPGHVNGDSMTVAHATLGADATALKPWRAWAWFQPQQNPQWGGLNPQLVSYAGDFLGDGNVEILWLDKGPIDPALNQPPTVSWPGALYYPANIGGWAWEGGSQFQYNWPSKYMVYWPAAADIDGDGFLDRLAWDQNIDNIDTTKGGWANGFDAGVEFTQKKRDGTIVPFGHPIDGTTTYDVFAKSGTCIGGGTQWQAVWTSRIAWQGRPFPNPPFTLADMDGDGLQDIIIADDDGFRYWRGRGDGWFGDKVCQGDATFGLFCECDRGVPFTMGNPPVDDPLHTRLFIHDVDGDGLADVIVPSPDGASLHLFLNRDGTQFEPTGPATIRLDAFTDFDPAKSTVAFADVNGSGVDDIVVITPTQARYFDLYGGTKPGLLTRIDNGLGTTTTIDYASTAKYVAEAHVRGTSWPTPQIEHVVSMLQTDNGLGNGAHHVNLITTFDYGLPVYDQEERKFLGFGSVRSTAVGDQAAPDQVTEATYTFGLCPHFAGQGCTTGIDNPYQAIRALPTRVEVKNGQGTYLSTTHSQYRLQHEVSGTDGRSVYLSYVEQSDQWLYDTTAPATTSQIQVTDVNSTTSNVPSYDKVPLVIRNASAFAHLKTTYVVTGIADCQTQQTDWGVVDSVPASPPDAPIGTSIVWQPIGAIGDWTWRPTMQRRSYTDATGIVPSGQRRELTYAYDALGNLTDVFGALSGTVPLARYHEAPAAQIAQPPTSASVDNPKLLLVHRVFDSLGNVTDVQGPIIADDNGSRRSCTHIVYDQVFRQLPTLTSALGGKSAGPDLCGVDAQGTSRIYDRGLGVVRDAFAPDDGRSSWTYDGFGRLIEARAPAPDVPDVLNGVPSLLVDYFVSDGQPVRVHVWSLADTLQRVGGGTRGIYRDAWQYVDGLGRPLVTIAAADPLYDGAPWIVSGVTDVSTRGRVVRAYEPWLFYGDPATFPVDGPAQAAFTALTYDGFGRTSQTFALDGTAAAKVVYHPLAREQWDANNLSPTSPHANKPTITRFDGHGRVVGVDQPIYALGQIDVVTTSLSYLATGELTQLKRTHTASLQSYLHYALYDSLGRIVENYEPNTSFLDPVSRIRDWQYAYDDAGELVGTTDARGCGENLHYDALGRLVAEDYSPCRIGQPAYTPPDLTTGDGTEAFYRYDELEPGDPHADPTAVSQTGHLTAIADSATHTRVYTDLRGRVVDTQRQLAVPGDQPMALADRYALHWFRAHVRYDEADEVVAQSTGADVPELLDASGRSEVHATYSRRGLLSTANSSYGPLVTGAFYDADALPRLMTYGDAAATTAIWNYDAQRRLQAQIVVRGVTPAFWAPGTHTLGYTAPPPNTTTQQVLDLSLFTYDAVGNPTLIQDARAGVEWPPGAQPVTRKNIEYDDAYRLTKIDYDSGGDSFVAPTRDLAGALPDTAPASGTRIAEQDFSYDWQGNIRFSSDDKNVFFDRDLGVVERVDEKPNQIRRAGLGSNDLLTAQYDASGNLEDLFVERSSAACTAASGACTHRFAYEWDELGRLMRGRRWDYVGVQSPGAGLPTDPPAAELRMHYDASGQRVLKETTLAGAPTTYAADVLGSLRLDHATFDAPSNDYERTAETEQVYLMLGSAAFARVVYDGAGALPTLGGRATHVFFEIADQLGSTATVIDSVTGELVERATYQAYGGADSDYRPDRWKAFWERYRFTGKETDAELGLTYFGARYYSPQLGQWISADPLAIHAFGADPNPYAYVGGNVLGSVDPLGLGLPEGDMDDPPPPEVPTYANGVPIDGPGGPRLGQPVKETQPVGHVVLAPQVPLVMAVPGPEAGCGAGPACASDVAPEPGTEMQHQSLAASETWVEPGGFSERWNPNASQPAEAMLLGSWWETGPVAEAQNYASNRAIATFLSVVQPEVAVIWAIATITDPHKSTTAKAWSWFTIGTVGLGAAVGVAGRATRTARAYSVAAEAGGLVRGAESYRIIDGVRRAKAAAELGQETIQANVQIGDKIVGSVRVSPSELLSPKGVIEVNTQRQLRRWLSILKGTQAGDPIPPITITPGNAGTPIPEVGFQF